MKVLLIHNEYRRPTGEETIFYSIVGLLKKEGHDVRTFIRRSSDLPAGWRGPVHAFFSGIWSQKSAGELDATLEGFRPDIVQVQNIYPLLSPAILPVIKAHKVPFVFRCANYRLFCPTGLMLRNDKPCHKCAVSDERWCVVHNCEGSAGRSIGYALRNRVARPRFLSSVHQFLVLSSFQRDRFREWGVEAERISVVPNFVDENAIQIENLPERTEGKHGLPDRSDSAREKFRYVAYAGRMSQEKGLGVLFEAARRLPDVRFRCAGNLIRMPAEAGPVPSNVEILGELPRSDLGSFYANSEFLVVPSIWYETFGLVTVEAMLTGRPVIASRIGALSDIVDHEATGLLVEPGNADDLTDAIRILWADPHRCARMGAAARDKAKRDYSADTYMKNLLAAYERAGDVAR